MQICLLAQMQPSPIPLGNESSRLGLCDSHSQMVDVATSSAMFDIAPCVSQYYTPLLRLRYARTYWLQDVCTVPQHHHVIMQCTIYCPLTNSTGAGFTMRGEKPGCGALHY